MKKYKLIKEYPGSPKLGTIEEPIGKIHQMSNGNYGYNINNSPEHWEEVVEKNYEILTYKNFITGDINYIGQRFLSNEGYRKFTKKDLNAVHQSTGKKIYFINSVKRLSDGEIFTIGDKVKFQGNGCSDITVILKFEFVNSKIHAHSGSASFHINFIQDLEKPLFTTEDGVDIFEGDEVWGITKDIWKLFYRNAHNTPTNTAVNEKWLHGKFSTKKAAEEYILMNKPYLSLNDVFEVYPEFKKENPTDKRTFHAEKLINLVKSKL